MKKILILVGLLVFLILACGQSQAVPTRMVVATVPSELTPTPKPTLTPRPTRTPEPETPLADLLGAADDAVIDAIQFMRQQESVNLGQRDWDQIGIKHDTAIVLLEMVIQEDYGKYETYLNSWARNSQLAVSRYQDCLYDSTGSDWDCDMGDSYLDDARQDWNSASRLAD